MNSSSPSHPSGWSNRILTLAITAILVLTLYPFRFDFARRLPRALFPFSLGGWGKEIGALDDFLNVLLFVPYGFGLAEKLRERGKSRLATLGFSLAAGAVLSYGVELLQIYIPFRDSGWEDILTNSCGALVGALLFDLWGGAVLHLFSVVEHKVGAWLSWQRALAVLLVYIGFWSAVTLHLQKETRLSDWNPDSSLLIGNSALSRFSSAWKGQVFLLEIWDRALSPKIARTLNSSGLRVANRDSVVAYRFIGPGPFSDERRLLPDLSWTPQAPISANPSGAFFDGTSWLTSPGAVPALVGDLKKTGQFSFRVVCEPAEIGRVNARIVSLSSPSGPVNLELFQGEANLAFWFRTPLSVQHDRMSLVMSWLIPKVFAANERRDILFTFDSANLNLFVDGKEYRREYELGAGAALARLVRRIKAHELKGYKYVFYALVFVPAGCLVGFAWRSITGHWTSLLFWGLLGLAGLPVIFEVALIHASGAAMSLENIWLSILWVAGGSVWINIDSGYPRSDR